MGSRGSNYNVWQGCFAFVAGANETVLTALMRSTATVEVMSGGSRYRVVFQRNSKRISIITKKQRKVELFSNTPATCEISASDLLFQHSESQSVGMRCFALITLACLSGTKIRTKTQCESPSAAQQLPFHPLPFCSGVIQRYKRRCSICETLAPPCNTLQATRV